MRPPRSAAMRHVLDTLKAARHSAAWLSRRLEPKVARQTVSGWPDVPDHYVGQVAKLLKLSPCAVRPDLAALFEKPPRKAVSCTVRQQA